MDINLRIQNSNDFFIIKNQLIDKYIYDVNGDFFKILLFLLRNPDINDTNDICLKTGLSEDAVLEGVNFWVSENIFIVDNKIELQHKKTENNHCQNSNQNNVNIISNRPSFIPKSEIAEKINSDSMISYIFETSEALLGRLLTSSEQRGLVNIYEWIKLPPDIIIMLLSYCVQIKKDNIRYIETTAANWSDLGINTYEAANQHIEHLLNKNENETLIKSAFGIYNRKLSAQEQKYCNKWINEQKFGFEMIKLAYDKTIDSINQISFPYIDKILSNWYDKNITNPKQALDEKNINKNQYEDNQNQSYSIGNLESLNCPNVEEV